MRSHTQRTIKWIKDQDWRYAIVECWIPGARIRRDAFGLFDIIAIANEDQTIGVQSTSGSGMAEHRRKILANDNALPWLRAGNQILLIGWRKVKKKRGGKLMIWQPRIEWITEEDFEQ